MNAEPLPPNGRRNYVVHGAGAIGAVVAARLADAGCDVRLVARGSHLEATQRFGLRLSGMTEGLYRLPAAADAHGFALDDQTVVVLAMKTHDMFAAVSRHLGHYEGLPLVCFQNGVSNEAWLAERSMLTYGAMVRIGARISEPGHVQHTGARHALIGCWPTGSDEVCEAIVDDLRAGDLNAHVSDDVRSAKWGKLVINLANAYLALVNRSVQDCYGHEPTRQFLADIEQEAMDVIEASGIDVTFGGNAGLSERIERLRDTPAAPREGDLPSLPTYPSTWQDLQAGRTSVEVEHFNGTIVKLGREVGVATPINQALWELCEDAAARGLGVGTQTDASLREAAVAIAGARGGT